MASETVEPRLAVVLGPAAVADEGVAKHLGGTPETANSTYHAFFADRLPLAFLTTAQVRETRVLDPAAYDHAGSGPRPSDGTQLTFEGFDPDLVLFVDTLRVSRATYLGNVMGGGPATGSTLRLDTDIVLWDNRTGREVASGRLETEEGLPNFQIRKGYEDVVGEFVEQLAQFTPVNLRKERPRQRRNRQG